MRLFFLFLVISFFLLSCFSKNNKRIIASVNEKNLFLEEVLNEMPIEIEDSAYFVEIYMNKWIRKQLMIYHAEINLSSNLKDYKKQIEEYKNSLLIYAYHQELLNQDLDTSIQNSEIQSYYMQYKDQFKLNKNIFKGRFIIVEKSAPNLELMNKLFKTKEEDELDNLIDYCQQFVKEYYLEDEKWEYFSIFNEKLPALIEQEAFFLKNTKSIVFEDDVFKYYLYINDYLLRGNFSPLSMEKKKIKNVLLNKKKIKYLKQLEDELYQNALALEKIKIY